MNDNKIKSIRYNIFILAVLCNICIFSQDCDEGYTPIAEDCYFSNDLAVIDDLISLNDLDYPNKLDAGVQTWSAGRLINWVISYTQNGINGVNKQLIVLPDNIGNLTSLLGLFVEWNHITVLPASFTYLTNLSTLKISNNYLTSLPENIGDLTNLITLDLGYNQITSIPESIENLQNIMFFWIFYNQLSQLPQSICELPLDWDGYNFSNYPYFASGGNLLCDSALIPDCVETSANFEISLDQFYYSFPQDAGQDCNIPGCTDPESYNCEDDDDWSTYIFDIGGVMYDNSCNWDWNLDTWEADYIGGCETGPCDGYYNPDATSDDGSCRYYQAPHGDEVVFSTNENGISVDWSAFNPPANADLESYHVQRCIEFCTWIPGFTLQDSNTGTSFFDAYSIENFPYVPGEEIKYAIAVKYASNPYWGWAIGASYITPCNAAGDTNGDGSWNVLDIVVLANCVLAENCDEQEGNGCAGDTNGDGLWNVLDIVVLANCVLAENCGG